MVIVGCMPRSGLSLSPINPPPPFHQCPGEEIRHPSSLDNDLSNEIFQCRGDVPATQGITMGTDCFYEGQARLDGAIAEHDMADKNAFLQVRWL